MKNEVLVFDMDGVLAEVSGSYLAAIAATVLHFTGEAASLETINDYKKAGGWNNDWALAQKLILDTAQRDVPYPEVVEVFQSLFLGQANDGLITRETWIPEAGLLERLGRDYSLGIFSGRTRFEINLTLSRCAPALEWATIIADAEVTRAKPAPDGLLAIAAAHPGLRITYIGDNVDDAASARAAGVRFVGVTDGDAELAERLRAGGAFALIENVNQLEAVL